jgi:capsular polysaccharide biosynthesis protein
MQNETTNYKPQQSTDEQSIDIKQLIYICLSHWYLFVIFVVLALAVGFVINRYKPSVYQTSGTVLIKSDQTFDPTSLMTNLNTGKSNVENEMAILRSYSLAERTIKKMNLEVTYSEKGRVSTVELYKTAPFTVEFDRSVPQAVGLTYEITAFNTEAFSLHGTSEFLTKYDYVLCQTLQSVPQKVDVVTECKQGEWIDNGYNRFRIVLNENYNPEKDNSRKLYFRLNSYPSLVRQLSSYTVSATSKQSSVVSIVMNGSNPGKIVEFTNMLMNEYVNR